MRHLGVCIVTSSAGQHDGRLTVKPLDAAHLAPPAMQTTTLELPPLESEVEQTMGTAMMLNLRTLEAAAAAVGSHGGLSRVESTVSFGQGQWRRRIWPRVTGLDLT